MLHDPRAHEDLVDTPWSPRRAEEEIRAIARDADQALRGGDRWWPVHPLDAMPDDPATFRGVYLGAAGVLWALHRLAEAGLHDEPKHDYPRLAHQVLKSYRSNPDADGPAASLWMGEAGIALVAWLLAPAPDVESRLAEIVTTAPTPDTQELMWGSPGLLIAADVMLERTGDQRWAAAWTALAARLTATQGARVTGLWTQVLYGSTVEYLGPAHGSAGIVAALARRPELLPDDQVVERATAALADAAIQRGAHANWPPTSDLPLAEHDGTIRTQWCHGAPGIVASLAELPGADDDLLLAGGELTWAAGPLQKGANLCHGTAGNGLALLKLFTRTQDERWLHRARRFAMHAAAQTATARGRHSLMAGDLGTAVYLEKCLSAGR